MPPQQERLCSLRGPCKVVMKNNSFEKSGVEFRDAFLRGYELGARRIELSRVESSLRKWQLQNNGKKGN
jgi:hypothetical protein